MGAVIESSVRIAGDRVRITVQLIDGQTDRHLWAEVYDRELSVESVFSIQQEVAIDPEFAEAWATLGWAYSFVGTLDGRQPPREV